MQAHCPCRLGFGRVFTLFFSAGSSSGPLAALMPPALYAVHPQMCSNSLLSIGWGNVQWSASGLCPRVPSTLLQYVRVCVCACVRVCVRTCVCARSCVHGSLRTTNSLHVCIMQACTRTRTLGRTHAHLDVRKHARTHTCTHTCTHARTHARVMHACTHAHMHARTYACMHTHAHLHACLYAQMHKCTHACMHACTHAHTYMHTRTCGLVYAIGNGSDDRWDSECWSRFVCKLGSQR